jgi:HAMP domain-containing protein
LPFAVVGATDPESTRLVYAMVIGLVVIGVVLILLAVWIIRQTRPDLEVLAPLERMGDGDWKKRDPSTQRRMLDEVRPEGAQPLTTEPMPPGIDAEFEQAGRPVSSFSDLGPGVNAEPGDPTPFEVGPVMDADAEASLDQEAPASEVDGDDAGPADEIEATADEIEANADEIEVTGDEIEVTEVESEAADDAGGDAADAGGDAAGDEADDVDDDADSDEALSDPAG